MNTAFLTIATPLLVLIGAGLLGWQKPLERARRDDKPLDGITSQVTRMTVATLWFCALWLLAMAEGALIGSILWIAGIGLATLCWSIVAGWRVRTKRRLLTPKQ